MREPSDPRGDGAAGPPVAVAFRRATNADRALAARLVDGALREYGLRVLPDSSDVDLTDLERHYDARGGGFEILEGAGGEPLGVLGWRPAADGAGGRGAGRGAGRVCELKKLYLARAAGCRAVVLETAAALAEANRLYTRFGFVPVRGAEAGAFAALSDQCDLAYRLDLAR